MEAHGGKIVEAIAIAGFQIGFGGQALGEHHRTQVLANQARDLAERCGAELLKHALRQDLDGFQPAEPADAGQLSSLSDAERRVARLAADGYSNQQISHRLHVTVSTVEQHLTRVFRKLGVNSRTDLPPELLPDMTRPGAIAQRNPAPEPPRPHADSPAQP